MKVGKGKDQSVLAMENGSASSTYKTAEVGRFNDRGEWQAEKNSATAAQPTTAKPMTGGDNTAGTGGVRPTRRSLPRTASPLPLFELLTGLSIARGLVVLLLRKAV